MVVGLVATMLPFPRHSSNFPSASSTKSRSKGAHSVLLLLITRVPLSPAASLVVIGLFAKHPSSSFLALGKSELLPPCSARGTLEIIWARSLAMQELPALSLSFVNIFRDRVLLPTAWREGKEMAMQQDLGTLPRPAAREQRAEAGMVSARLQPGGPELPP